MRGADERAGSMFSYVSLEDHVPKDHPLRAIRRITDRALERLSPQFDTLHVHFGRPSVPPKKLLPALVLQALFTIRSERQLMEQLDSNLLFRRSLDSASTIRCGRPRPSPKLATACSTATSRPPSSKRC